MDAYRLVRSRRRTLALEITREGEVVVRAPMGLSQKRIDQFVADHRGWIAEHLERQRRRPAARPEPTEEERSEYIRRAREELPERVARYAARMGVRPAGITITGARKRFGSCSGKNRLCRVWENKRPEPRLVCGICPQGGQGGHRCGSYRGGGRNRQRLRGSYCKRSV